MRYDKKAQNYLALLKLACGLIWYRDINVLDHVIVGSDGHVSLKEQGLGFPSLR